MTLIVSIFEKFGNWPSLFSTLFKKRKADSLGSCYRTVLIIGSDFFLCMGYKWPNNKYGPMSRSQSIFFLVICSSRYISNFSGKITIETFLSEIYFFKWGTPCTYRLIHTFLVNRNLSYSDCYKKKFLLPGVGCSQIDSNHGSHVSLCCQGWPDNG